MRRSRLGWLVPVVCSAAGGTASGQTYRVTDVGTMGDGFSVANAINAGGQVVGYNDTRAFLYSSGNMTDLGTLKGVSQANAINSAGQITGRYQTGFDFFYGPLYSGFRYSGGTMTSITSLISGEGINSSGQVAGMAWVSDIFGNKSQHAYLQQSNGTVRDLDPSSGLNFGASYGINDRGQVVGRSPYVGGAFLWSPATPNSTTGTMMGLAVGGTAYAINAGGQVVGTSDSGSGGDAFLWTPTTPNATTGSVAHIGTLGGSSSTAHAINTSGQVVGDANLAGDTDQHAFLYAGGVIKDLNAMMDSSGIGWGLKSAHGINDSGLIVGSGTNADGATHAFVLTPLSGLDAQWKINGNGNWTAGGNWNPGSPMNAACTALLGSSGGAITVSPTVTLDAPGVGVKTLTFDLPTGGGYTIAGADKLTVGSFANNGMITVNSGAHTIAAPLALLGNTTIAVAGTLTVNNLQPTAALMNKSGPGTLMVNNVRSGGLTIGGGMVRVLASGGASGVSTVTSLSIDGGAKLDLSNNKLVTATPVDVVTALIQSGRAGGAWSGSGIITSQSAAVTGNYTSLGIATAAEAKGIAVSETTTWAGQTVAGTDALVMYTYGGDATLDGKINVDDYIRIDNGIAAGLTGWSNGDFNYDGKVNIDDYTQFIDANIGTQGAPFPTAGGVASSVAVVPEPAGASIFLGAVALGMRRRRRRTM